MRSRPRTPPRTPAASSASWGYLPSPWLARALVEPSCARRSRAAASSRLTCRQPAQRPVRWPLQSLTGRSPQQRSSRYQRRWRSHPGPACTSPVQSVATSFLLRPSVCYAVLAATPLTWLVRATSTSPSARRQAQSSRLRATLWLSLLKWPSWLGRSLPAWPLGADSPGSSLCCALRVSS